MAAGVKSPEFEIKFKNMNDVNLFNTDNISTSSDKNKDTCLVCVPLLHQFKRNSVFESIFEYVKLCKICHIYLLFRKKYFLQTENGYTFRSYMSLATSARIIYYSDQNLRMAE